MKHQSFYILIILFTTFSCSGSDIKESNNSSSDEARRNELKNHELVSDIQNDEQNLPDQSDVEKDTFPGDICTHGTLCILDGYWESGGADAVFTHSTGEEYNLSEKATKEIIDILANPESYGNSVAACFEPRHGIIFYNDEDQITGYCSFCMSCNNIYSKPKINYNQEYHHGFSTETRNKIIYWLEKYGSGYDSYSPLFDDNDQYAKLLKLQGLSDEEIKKEIELNGNNN